MSGDTHEKSTQPKLSRDELSRVFGPSVASWSAELLVHNPRNVVTLGVWRVRAGGQSAILKVLARVKDAASKTWVSTDDPTHWNFWRCEALAYESGVMDVFADAGIEAPAVICIIERSPDEIALWLEDVQGRSGDTWELEDHCAAASALGRAHAAAGSRGEADLPWLSRRFLRSYSDMPVDSSLVEDDSVWRRPLVAECLGPRVRESGRKLLAERAWLLSEMESLPRTLCHLDFWPMNLIRRPTGEVVALDWGFMGDGAIGEDLGNLIPDSAFDLFVPSSELATLDDRCFSAFMSGMVEAGWQGDEATVRLGVCASAVKYTWLLPLMLERALSGEYTSYGGSKLEDPRKQFRERGETLNFLADWVDEAHNLTAKSKGVR